MQRSLRMMYPEPTDPLPIRRRLTILRDGSTSAASIVFCDPEMRSVPLSRCATCRFGGALERDAQGREATIECSRFTLSSSHLGRESDPPPSGERLCGAGAASVAAMLPVGLSLVRPIVCVAYDAPLRVAARALEMTGSAFGVAVVEGEGRLVGILPRATATLARLRSAADAVAEHMAVEWSVVDESESLGAAFGTMTARRARELSVVGEGRAVVGTLRDIDALRFVSYVSRTGLRPPAERAA